MYLNSYLRFLPALVIGLCVVNSLFADSALNSLRGKVSGLRSTFSASFTYTSSGGAVKSGKIYYKSPNKLHLRMNDGGIVATNGSYLWIFRTGSYLCAKQEVGGRSGGLLGMLRSYSGQVVGNRYIFKKPGAHYEEIVVNVNKGMISNVTLKNDGQSTTFSFHNVQVGRGIKASLFNFRPPTNARVVENPLNQ